ncbi:MAG: DUF2007 domain-containing protein [bacterium]
MSEEEFTYLCGASSEMEADVIKSYLESNGIEVLLTDSITPYWDRAYMGLGGPVDIWVHPGSKEEALRLLKEIEEEPTNDTTKG